MLLTRAAVTRARDRVMVRLRPRWHHRSLKPRPHFESKQGEILCAAHPKADHSFSNSLMLACGLCGWLLDARNNVARELRIRAGSAPERSNRREPIRPLDWHDL